MIYELKTSKIKINKNINDLYMFYKKLTNLQNRNIRFYMFYNLYIAYSYFLWYSHMTHFCLLYGFFIKDKTYFYGTFI